MYRLERVRLQLVKSLALTTTGGVGTMGGRAGWGVGGRGRAGSSTVWMKRYVRVCVCLGSECAVCS